MTTQINLVPKRRFEEFNDSIPWEQLEFGEVLKINSGRDYKHLDIGDIPVYGTGGYMLSVNEKLSAVDGIGIGRKGTIDKPQYLKAPFWTVDTLFFMTPLANYDIDFLFSMSQNIKWRQLNESTGVPSLSKVVIEKIARKFPSYQEQKRIGAFFKHLDELIILQRRKLEKRKALKAAYLSEMFPAQGESEPKRRFDGFTQPWIQRRIEDLAEVSTGKAFSSKDFSAEGEYLVVTNKNIKDQEKGIVSVGDRIDISENKIVNNYVLSGNNILVTMDGVNIGKTGRYSNEKAVLAQRVGRLKSEQHDFIYQITSSSKFIAEMNRISVGNAIKHISLSQISNYSFMAPVSTDEQAKIGNFFKLLDDTITLHQSKLEKLQNLKKAYLNEMFV